MHVCIHLQLGNLLKKFSEFHYYQLRKSFDLLKKFCEFHMYNVYINVKFHIFNKNAYKNTVN